LGADVGFFYVVVEAVVAAVGESGSSVVIRDIRHGRDLNQEDLGVGGTHSSTIIKGSVAQEGGIMDLHNSTNGLNSPTLAALPAPRRS
jgi:hypothetical protein